MLSKAYVFTFLFTVSTMYFASLGRLFPTNLAPTSQLEREDGNEDSRGVTFDFGDWSFDFCAWHFDFRTWSFHC